MSFSARFHFSLQNFLRNICNKYLPYSYLLIVEQIGCLNLLIQSIKQKENFDMKPVKTIKKTTLCLILLIWTDYIYKRFIYLMPWNFVCDPWVLWSFDKTTIIRQLRKWKKIILLTAWWLLFCKKSMEPRGLQTKFHSIKYINLFYV